MSQVILPLLLVSIWLSLPLVYGYYKYKNARMIFRKRFYSDRIRNRDRKSDEVQLTLAALWTSTQGRLNYYHEIALSQAQRSFVSSQVASIIGFLILAGSVVVVFTAKSTSTAIGASVSGVAGGALGAYLGRTFLRTQENSAAQLRQYFDQPLEFSRYLAAERLAADLEDPKFRAQAVSRIVRSIAREQISGSVSAQAEAKENTMSDPSAEKV